MSSAASGDARHPAEDEWIRYVEKHLIHQLELWRNVQWLKEKYPGSFTVLRPRLAALYRTLKP